MNHPRVGLFLGVGASKPFDKFTTKEFKDYLLMQLNQINKNTRNTCYYV
ncbi:MAG: hypothetical protein L0H53_16270 [Candidatus Nitrosocosmicus sp.]|nr:hypothetical protein [Candidatus Nitrosocosmicus sp.]